MKKSFKILVLLLVICGVLCGCNNSKDKKSDKKSQSNTLTQMEKPVFNADKVLSQLEVAEYKIVRENSWYSYDYSIYLIIENKSDFNITLNAQITTYDEEKNIIEIFDKKISTFGSKSKAVLDIDDCDDFDTFDYTFSVDVFMGTCEASKLEYEITEGKNDLFVTVNNNSAARVEDVDGFMLYFNNDELTGVERRRFDSKYDRLEANQSDRQEYSKLKGCTSYEFIVFGNWQDGSLY